MTPQNTTYNYICLGTDTHYADCLKPPYARCETLSAVFDALQGKRMDDKRILDGQDITGQVYGSKIALSILDLLQAIGRGKRTINIAAHSRGACQAILIVHELQHILDNIHAGADALNDEIIQKIFKCSPDVAIRSQLIRQWNVLGSIEKNNIRAALRKGRSGALSTTLDVGIFNIDPVPGGGIYHWWGDKRLCGPLPPLVKRYEQVTYLHERSKCFQCICPPLPRSREGGPLPSFFEEIILPGNHSTGSGNFGYQQTVEGRPRDYNTSGVQDLVFVKLLAFFNSRGGILNPSKIKENEEVVTDQTHVAAKSLKGLARCFINTQTDSLQAYNRLLADIYKDIWDNKRGYEMMADHYYRGLGQWWSGSARCYVTAFLEAGRGGWLRDTSTVVSVPASLNKEQVVNREHQYLLKVLEPQAISKTETSPGVAPASFEEDLPQRQEPLSFDDIFAVLEKAINSSRDAQNFDEAKQLIVRASQRLLSLYRDEELPFLERARITLCVANLVQTCQNNDLKKILQETYQKGCKDVINDMCVRLEEILQILDRKETPPFLIAEVIEELNTRHALMDLMHRSLPDFVDLDHMAFLKDAIDILNKKKEVQEKVDASVQAEILSVVVGTTQTIALEALQRQDANVGESVERAHIAMQISETDAEREPVRIIPNTFYEVGSKAEDDTISQKLSDPIHMLIKEERASHSSWLLFGITGICLGGLALGLGLLLGGLVLGAMTTPLILAAGLVIGLGIYVENKYRAQAYSLDRIEFSKTLYAKKAVFEQNMNAKEKEYFNNGRQSVTSPVAWMTGRLFYLRQGACYEAWLRGRQEGLKEQLKGKKTLS
jgi:hypothetical protein